MTNVKISELPEGSSVTVSDVIICNQSGTTKQISLSTLQDLFADSINVEKYSVVAGSGLTSAQKTANATGIRAAVDYAVNNGKKLIFFPASEYEWSGTVDFKHVDIQGSHTILEGDKDNIGKTFNCFYENIDISQPKYYPQVSNSSNNKIVYSDGDSANTMHVITKGKASYGTYIEFIRELVAPSGPGTGEFWRTGQVLSLAKAGAYLHEADAETGAWEDYIFSSTHTLFEFKSGYASLSTKIPAKIRRTVELSASRSWDIDIDETGKTTLAFLMTSASSTSCQVKVDSVLHTTLDLSSTLGSRIRTVEISGIKPGTHTIQIVNNDSGNYVYSIGINYSDLENLSVFKEYDSCFAVQRSPNYIANRGASDFAIRSANDGIILGSYHGGETANTAAKWFIDGIDEATSLASGACKVGKQVDIFQDTTIDWSNGNDVLVNKSITSVGDSEVSVMFDFSGTLDTSTFYCGMTTTADTFNQMYIPKFVDFTVDAQYYSSDYANQYVQTQETYGVKIISEITPIRILNDQRVGAPHVYTASGAYNKFRYGFVADATMEGITNVNFGFRRIFA